MYYFTNITFYSRKIFIIKTTKANYFFFYLVSSPAFLAHPLLLSVMLLPIKE